MKKVARTIMLMGRATVFTVGLAVTLALMIGVATTALAAVPGDPLRLGRINAVDAASTLVGSVNGAMLTIENNSPGSRGAPAPALSLEAQSGNPPLVANPEAGTATNLSADELDGLDQGAFLRAGGKATDADKLDGKDSGQFLTNTGKAADADRLDGKDSSAFWTGKAYNLGSSPVTGAPFTETIHEAGPCDPGDRAINGNYHFLGGSGDHEIVREQLFSDSFLLGWSNGPVADTVNMNVTCADFPPLR